MHTYRELEKDSQLVTVTLEDTDYMGKIRFAVEEGLPVLFEDVGTLIPRHLNYILSRQTFLKKKKTYVKVCMYACM